MQHNRHRLPLSGGVFRGKIIPNGCSDASANPANQTLVDIYMYDLLPVLYRVPVLSPKINITNGEYMHPEPGDLVAVSFFSGNQDDPVVIGFLPPANNSIQKPVTDPLECRRAWQGTTETIGKTGARTVHVAENDVLEVVGNCTITVHGNVAVTVDAGKTITLTGNTTVVGDFTASGFIKDVSGVHGSVGDLRTTYNGHRHGGVQGGGSSTGTPSATV